MMHWAFLRYRQTRCWFGHARFDTIRILATIIDTNYRPRLRPLEALPLNDGNGLAISVHDPSGLSHVALSMSAPALQLLALMDGSHSVADIQERFLVAVGQPVSIETIEKLIEHLEEARFLEGDRFESHYAALLANYRSGGVRPMPHAADLGIDDSGSVFGEILAEAANAAIPGVVRGVVAPHLDYKRGRPCYGAAYASLCDRVAPDRVVILGTNHFGRSRSVVATGNDFETPLGRTTVDRAFLEKLEETCGDLRRFELDHMREHSVELQVAFVQYLFGAESITIVPFLCPDPCGPTGTAPADGEGVDLERFARALREAIHQDKGRDTLIIAGADMSHVGPAFGDDHALDDDRLERVRGRDRQSLDWLEVNNPSAFVSCIAEGGNPTSVCSAGCMYAIRSILHDATAHVLRYHQAVDPQGQSCVTCAAVAFA